MLAMNCEEITRKRRVASNVLRSRLANFKF